jgi:hypothetical protein
MEAMKQAGLRYRSMRSREIPLSFGAYIPFEGSELSETAMPFGSVNQSSWDCGT